jgi:hypothetical protein
VRHWRARGQWASAYGILASASVSVPNLIVGWFATK